MRPIKIPVLLALLLFPAIAQAKGAEHIVRKPAPALRAIHAKPAAPARVNASSLMEQGLDLAKRGRGAEALSVASRISDPVMADIVRGEAYAMGGASANASELFSFSKRHPVWPQRNTILANAEGQLSLGQTYEPMLDLYSADNPPATANGFAIWQATLQAHGRNREAEAAEAARANAPVSDDAGESARWKDIHMQIRDKLSQQDYAGAYQLANGHGLAAPSANGGANAGDYASAEFLCGWLSLRYLHAPDRAMQHFQQLYDNVKTPVSRTRAAYWLGRTAEALGNPGAARGWYQEAAAMPTFFYGQLALAKLDKNATLVLPPEPTVPASIATKWNAGGLPRAVRILTEAGDEDREIRFMKALLQGSDTRAEFALAGLLSRDLHRPYLEVLTAKAANQKGIVLGQVGFPKLDVEAAPTPYGSGVSEPALTLGIIRQESEFRPDVRSNAGAVGLMQLMPATAQIVAKNAPGGLQRKPAHLARLQHQPGPRLPRRPGRGIRRQLYSGDRRLQRRQGPREGMVGRLWRPARPQSRPDRLDRDDPDLRDAQLCAARAGEYRGLPRPPQHIRQWRQDRHAEGPAAHRRGSDAAVR